MATVDKRSWRLDLKFVRSPEATKRELQKALKPSYAAVVQTWWKDMSPKHFDAAAATTYGYAKRSPKTWARRARRPNSKSMYPLYDTGVLREAFLSRSPDTIATGKGARGVFRKLPRYAYIVDKSRSDVNIPLELTITTQAEGMKLAKFLSTRLKNAMDKARD